jgi:hypothetical protein
MTNKVRVLEIPFMDPARQWFPECPSTPLRYAQGERFLHGAKGERLMRIALGDGSYITLRVNGSLVTL